jgi:hypothetical protein
MKYFDDEFYMPGSAVVLLVSIGVALLLHAACPDTSDPWNEKKFEAKQELDDAETLFRDRVVAHVTQAGEVFELMDARIADLEARVEDLEGCACLQSSSVNNDIGWIEENKRFWAVNNVMLEDQ